MQRDGSQLVPKPVMLLTFQILSGRLFQSFGGSVCEGFGSRPFFVFLSVFLSKPKMLSLDCEEDCKESAS